jgi:transposase
VSILHIENLKWATGAKYGSKWTHGSTGEKIEHSAARAGIRVKRVSARNTSQTCHACGKPVTHNTLIRVATCTTCRSRLDRDVNAALNIAKNKGASVPLEGTIGSTVGTIPGVTATAPLLVVSVTQATLLLPLFQLR